MSINETGKQLTAIINNDLNSKIRELPKNIDAEQALLGAILSNNQALEKVEDFLNDDDFSSNINKVIYSTLKKIIHNDQLADINTVRIFLENQKIFNEDGTLRKEIIY